MRIGHRAPLALVVAAIGMIAFAAAPAAAQDQPARVATADPARIFNEMQETVALKARLENERKGIEAEEKNRRQRLQDLQSARDLLKPDSQQYADAQKQLMQAAIEFETWGKIMQNDIVRNQKLQMRQLFDRITAATSEVAKKRGFDIVIADQRPEWQNFEQLNVNQVRDQINLRNVLYASEKVDLTGDVIKLLDEQFKAAGGTVPAAPTTPAPAPTPPGTVPPPTGPGGAQP